MILISILLAALTFNHAILPRQTPTEGFIEAQIISPDGVCKPGAICSMIKRTGNFNNCFFTNVDNGTKGGTPLTIDVTQTGSQGSPVYIYWVNATNMDITIYGGKVLVNYKCV